MAKMEIETQIKRRRNFIIEEDSYKTAEEKTDIFEEEKKKIFEFPEEW